MKNNNKQKKLSVAFIKKIEKCDECMRLMPEFCKKHLEEIKKFDEENNY